MIAGRPAFRATGKADYDGAVSVAYDLSGRTSLVVDGQVPGLPEYLAAQMDPFRAGSSGAAGVLIETVGPRDRPLRDIQNAARDGVVTASDGQRLHVLADGRACEIPWPLGGRPLRFACEPGFPIARVFSRLIRPALQLTLHDADAVALHSAAVVLDGGAILVAGWSESGKTETALALMEEDAAFLSDKWTILGTDGEASAFPINVGVRRWVLPHLPRLRAALPAAARAQMAVAGAAAAVSRPARERPGRAGALAERAVALADRAALSPTQLRRAYGQDDDPERRVPLAATAVLTTVPGPEVVCQPADPSWAAARLARSAAYERRELFELAQRRGYAFPGERGDVRHDIVEREAGLLERALAQARVFELRAPFPVDPRRVASALRRAL
jgi:hypothetical protein